MPQYPKESLRSTILPALAAALWQSSFR
ncbi:MAG: hypothetical protein ACI4SZ_09685 [Lachnospiraceae bacterium]